MSDWTRATESNLMRIDVCGCYTCYRLYVRFLTEAIIHLAGNETYSDPSGNQ